MQPKTTPTHPITMYMKHTQYSIRPAFKSQSVYNIIVQFRHADGALI